jgi:hypothetical protein
VQRGRDPAAGASGSTPVVQKISDICGGWACAVFLCEMGGITVFGVLLLQFGNRVMNLVLPSLTIVALLSSIIFLAGAIKPPNVRVREEITGSITMRTD